MSYGYFYVTAAILAAILECGLSFFLRFFSSGFGVKSVQKQLQSDIQVIGQWFLNNGLIVNTDKTKTMLFASSKKKKTSDLKIITNR